MHALRPFADCPAGVLAVTFKRGSFFGERRIVQKRTNDTNDKKT
jgi:hypothetical protein